MTATTATAWVVQRLAAPTQALEIQSLSSR